MIRFDDVTVTYADARQPALSHVNLHLPEGELTLVVGPTGSGKSTLLLAVNGLVPHFTGGRLDGSVRVAGRDTRSHRPRDLADVVGMVLQDPVQGFVTDTVEEELAYGMESVGLPGDVMRRRVEEALDLLGLTDLRHRSLRTLSGGQQQRVAIGSVLTLHPRVLVLDEPTSALDPAAAEDVLAVLQRLVHDLGLTVLLAEHRLERVIQFADHLVRVHDDGTVTDGAVVAMLESSPLAPPLVELGRLAQWQPLPLTIRDARRHAGQLRERLAAVAAPPAPSPGALAPVIEIDDLTVRRGHTAAVDRASLRIGEGEIVAVMGRNGAGKSTLLRAVAGLERPETGRVTTCATDPTEWTPPELLRRVGFVPQEPGDLLWADAAEAECAQADRGAGSPPGTAAAWFSRLAPEADLRCHPRDLSEGQRLALAMAVILTAGAPVLVLDEPTRGLDYPTKSRVVALLREHAARGGTVLVATHDVELAAEVADRTVVLADGQVVADGPTARVVVGSPQFAPQVAKVLAPAEYLTVAQVAEALAVTA